MAAEVLQKNIKTHTDTSMHTHKQCLLHMCSMSMYLLLIEFLSELIGNTDHHHEQEIESSLLFCKVYSIRRFVSLYVFVGNGLFCEVIQKRYINFGTPSFSLIIKSGGSM